MQNSTPRNPTCPGFLSSTLPNLAGQGDIHRAHLGFYSRIELCILIQEHVLPMQSGGKWLDFLLWCALLHMIAHKYAKLLSSSQNKFTPDPEPSKSCQEASRQQQKLPAEDGSVVPVAGNDEQELHAHIL